MNALKPLLISGREVLPLVEGGKGISVSNGESSGPWAKSGGVGTFSGVNADSYDAQGRLILQEYRGKTRRERHEELIAYAIQGGIYQARIAHEEVTAMTTKQRPRSGRAMTALRRVIGALRSRTRRQGWAASLPRQTR